MLDIITEMARPTHPTRSMSLKWFSGTMSMLLIYVESSCIAHMLK